MNKVVKILEECYTIYVTMYVLMEVVLYGVFYVTIQMVIIFAFKIFWLATIIFCNMVHHIILFSKFHHILSVLISHYLLPHCLLAHAFHAKKTSNLVTTLPAASFFALSPSFLLLSQSIPQPHLQS